MWRHAFAIGLTLSVLLLCSLTFVKRAEVGERLGWTEPEPVLVFVIPDRDSASRVAAAIAPHRILWQGGAGLALQGGRVVSRDLDGAAEVIEQAGWIDSTIRIVRLEPSVASGGRGARGQQAAEEARRARLRELVNEPSLSRAEQLFVLNAMNDGIEF